MVADGRRIPDGSLFVGREWELAQLEAGLNETLVGRGQLFVVTGDAGIGKTRFAAKVAEVAERQDIGAVWGRCWEGEESPAFWPWIQVFRTVGLTLASTAGASPSKSVPSPPILEEADFFAPGSHFTASAHPSQQARFRLFDLATSFLRAAGDSRPLVLILEDLHEADRSSLALLEFVARHVGDMRLLLLATCREPEMDLTPPLREMLGRMSGHGHRIPLRGFEPDETAEFLNQGFGVAPEDEMLSLLQDMTRGNAFFLDGLARFMVAGGTIEDLAGTLHVPEGAKDALSPRLARVPAHARALLELASVIGREFSFDLLVEASGHVREDVIDGLTELTSWRLVEPAGFGLGPYRFVHALVREVIYQGLTSGDRCRLHRRVGLSIETLHDHDLDGQLDHLAHHFRQAAPLGEVDRAIEYSQLAGERAARQLGFDEAAAHYQKTLELVEEHARGPARRFEVLVALGDADWWAGRVSEAREAFEAAANLARDMNDPHRLAEAALRVGEVGYGGVYMEAWVFDGAKVRLLEEALGGLGDEESTLRARVLARLSAALYFSPFESAAREDLSLRAVEMARRLGDGSTLAYALNARHLAVWSPDNLQERLGLAAEVVELARLTGDHSLELIGHVWRLADLLEIGDVQEADREVEAFTTLAETLAYPQFRAYASMFRVMRALLRGDFTEAEDLARRSRQSAEQSEDANLVLSHHVQMAMLRALQGRTAECGAHLEFVTPRLGGDRGVVYRSCILALAGDRAGVEQALLRLRSALAQSPPAFRLGSLVPAAFLTAVADASEEGAAVYELLRPYEHRLALSGRDGVVCLGPVALYLGMLAASLARYDDAAGHFDAALEMAKGIGSRPYWALAEAGYGTMLVGRGLDADRPRAGQLLAHALKTATELGMSQLQREILAAQEACSISVPLTAASEASRPARATASFRNEGEYWSIAFEGRTVRLRDTKGLRYLQALLAAPGREFHVLDLAAPGAPAFPSGARSGGAAASALRGGASSVILDAAAKAAYRARIEELRGEIEEAEGNHDVGRADRLRSELDFVVAELKRAVGLGGADRRAVSPAERARSNVGKALRASMRHIGEVHPALGAHLETTVRTGYFCSYNPDPRLPIAWRR